MDFDIKVRAWKSPPPKGERLQLWRNSLRDEDFSGKKWRSVSVFASRLESCRFDRTRIESACFGSGREVSEYIDCSFDRSHIEFGPAGCARFVRCSFRNVRLKDWRCLRVELIDCVFTGRLEVAFFNGTVPRDAREYLHRDRNEFRGNDFSGMELIDVEFRTGIDLTQQHLPSGPDYLYLPDSATALAEVRRQVLSWSDLDTRREALSFIESEEFALRGGQQQLFLRSAAYSPRKDEGAYRVVEMLREFAAPPP